MSRKTLLIAGAAATVGGLLLAARSFAQRKEEGATTQKPGQPKTTDPAKGSATYVPSPPLGEQDLPVVYTSPTAAPGVQGAVPTVAGGKEVLIVKESYAAAAQYVSIRVNACGTLGMWGGPWAAANVAVFPEGNTKSEWMGGTRAEDPYKGQFNIALPPGRYTVMVNGNTFGDRYLGDKVLAMVGRPLMTKFDFPDWDHGFNIEVIAGSDALIDLPCI